MIGTHRFFDGHMDEPVELAVAGGHAVIYSRRAPGRTGPNEDAALVLEVDPGLGFLAVADGAGGHRQGDRASREGLLALEGALTSIDEDPELARGGILAAFDRANESVLAVGGGSASTLALVEVRGTTLRCYHVGDSQVLQFGQRGRRKYETMSHSPTGYAVEAGVLDEATALVHEDRHFISNFLGRADMRIDVGPIVDIAERDTVILATDGVFDNVFPEEIIDNLRIGKLVGGALWLAGMCQERMEAKDRTTPGKIDDVAFVLFRRTG